MKTRKLSLLYLMVACTALASALSAGIATAAPGEEIAHGRFSEWLVNGVPVASGTAKPISVSLEPYSRMTLKLVVGEEKKPLIVSCAGAEVPAGSAAYLESEGKASFDSLQLTSCAILTPSKCSLSSSSLRSEPLKAHISRNTLVIEPKAAVGRLFLIPVTGANCSVAGSKVVKGSLTGSFLNSANTSMLKAPVAFAESDVTGAGNPGTVKGELLLATS